MDTVAAAGSIGLASFYILKSINEDGQLNATASINRLTELGVATTFIQSR
jgi:hypothetical protein